MKKLVAFLAVFTLISAPAFAASEYQQKVQDKLVYGFKNLGLGWTEILQEPGEAIHNKTCIVKGFGEGIYNAVGDTLGGLVYIVTAPFPSIKVALPEGGTDITGSSTIK